MGPVACRGAPRGDLGMTARPTSGCAQKQARTPYIRTIRYGTNGKERARLEISAVIDLRRVAAFWSQKATSTRWNKTRSRKTTKKKTKRASKESKESKESEEGKESKESKESRNMKKNKNPLACSEKICTVPSLSPQTSSPAGCAGSVVTYDMPALSLMQPVYHITIPSGFHSAAVHEMGCKR